MWIIELPRKTTTAETITGIQRLPNGIAAPPEWEDGELGTPVGLAGFPKRRNPREGERAHSAPMRAGDSSGREAICPRRVLEGCASAGSSPCGLGHSGQPASGQP